MPGYEPESNRNGDLACLLYLSKATHSFTADELQDLEARASDANALLGITGYLFCDQGKFVQYIEGTPDKVDLLFNRVAGDPRHTVLLDLRASGLRTRRFPVWHMRRLTRRHMLGLEEVLAEHLTWVTQGPASLSVKDDLTWQMVDKISMLQNQL